MTEGRTSKASTLDRAFIARAAIALMNEIGIDAITMRRLADTLHVKGPALYWHFRNKEELLGLMCETLLVASASRVAPSDDWRQWLFDMALSTRSSMLNVRDGGRLVMMADWNAKVRSELFDDCLAPLVRQGVPETDGRQMIAAVSSYVLGWVVTEEREDHKAFLKSVFDIQGTFEMGLRAMVAGFQGPAIPGDASSNPDASTRCTE